MKITPLGKLILVVLGLTIIYFGVRNYFPDIRKWAVGQKAGAAQTAEVTSSDFGALKNAPPDPERGTGSQGVTAGSLSTTGRLSRPLVVGINTWAGHSPGIVFNNGLDPRTGLALQEEVRHGRQVRPPRGPRGEARGLPQGRHRHHVEHRGQLGARGVDPRRAEPEGQVDRDAGLVARRRRHRLARVDQARSRSSRATRSPAPSSRPRTSCFSTCWPSRGSRPTTGRRSRRASSSRRTRPPPPPCSRRSRSTRR